MADNENELNLMDSITMSDSGVHLLTLVSTSTNKSNDEVMNFIRELMGEMKQQNASLRGEMKEQLDKCFNELNNLLCEHIDAIGNDIKKRTEKWKRGAGKCNENKDDQVVDTKVGGVSESNNYHNMINNNDDIVEKVVLESKILNNGSDDEIVVGVEVSGEVAVDDIERECEVRLGEHEWQRANFPCGLSGVRTPHVVFEDKGSSRGVMWET